MKQDTQNIFNKESCIPKRVGILINISTIKEGLVYGILPLLRMLLLASTQVVGVCMRNFGLVLLSEWKRCLYNLFFEAFHI